MGSTYCTRGLIEHKTISLFMCRSHNVTRHDFQLMCGHSINARGEGRCIFQVLSMEECKEAYYQVSKQKLRGCMQGCDSDTETWDLHMPVKGLNTCIICWRRLYRVAQNLGKQVLRTHYLKFHSLCFDFAVFTHGERDLHSLPWMAGAAVQISLK